MDKHYLLSGNILFNGKYYGWALQYKKGKKTIVTFYPERKAFTVLLTFGADELKEIDNPAIDLSANTRQLITNTEKLHDGKWVWIRLDDSGLLKDILSLIKIKRKPDID